MNPEPLLVSSALLRHAEQRCRVRLAEDSDNPALLESLGEVLRKLGKLAEAAPLYARLARMKPEDERLQYVHALIAGLDPMPLPPSGLQPGPFVTVNDFLPASFHETLVPFTISMEGELTPAMVGNDQYAPDRRESLELRDASEVQARFAKHVRQFLVEISGRLHVPSFQLGRLEAKLRVYLDGHFFRLHMDNPSNSPTSCNRQISYVYFYHRMPRGYTGGDLLLFDTDLAANQFTTSGFTRIQPVDNSIVFFPSGVYHSVVPVTCTSKRIADSRFVINGHFSKVARAQAEVKSEERAPAEVVAEPSVAS
jgi:Rps23 Pro-64 3,4-dihydroxylase Tpa1-like proline 4-hydroxylase